MSKSYGALCKEQRVLCKVDDVEKLCSVGKLDDVASKEILYPLYRPHCAVVAFKGKQ